MQNKSIRPTWKLMFLVIVILLFFSSCYYDSKEYLYPELNSSCDTTNTSFTNSVTPILQQYCYACHGNTTAPSFGSNIKLQDYTDVKTYAESGSLTGAINHLNGYSPMPKGAGKIPACDILVIEQWTNNGTQNN